MLYFRVKRGIKPSSKKSKGMRLLFLSKEGISGSKLRKKVDERWGPFTSFSFQMRKQKLRRATHLVQGHMTEEDSNSGLYNPGDTFNHGMKCSRMMKMF